MDFIEIFISAIRLKKLSPDAVRMPLFVFLLERLHGYNVLKNMRFQPFCILNPSSVIKANKNSHLSQRDRATYYVS